MLLWRQPRAREWKKLLWRLTQDSVRTSPEIAGIIVCVSASVMAVSRMVMHGSITAAILAGPRVQLLHRTG
jgi:hypothetical protein